MKKLFGKKIDIHENQSHIPYKTISNYWRSMLENQKDDPNHSQEHLTAAMTSLLAQDAVDATASFSAESTIEQNHANIIPRTSNDNQMNDHSHSLIQIK